MNLLIRFKLPFAAGMLALAATLPNSATAKDATAYPDKTVKIIVPFPPGGAGGIIATQPDFSKRIEDIGGEVTSMTVRQSSDYLNGEFTRWAKVVKDRNIKAD